MSPKYVESVPFYHNPPSLEPETDKQEMIDALFMRFACVNIFSVKLQYLATNFSYQNIDLDFVLNAKNYI